MRRETRIYRGKRLKIGSITRIGMSSKQPWYCLIECKNLRNSVTSEPLCQSFAFGPMSRDEKTKDGKSFVCEIYSHNFLEDQYLNQSLITINTRWAWFQLQRKIF